MTAVVTIGWKAHAALARSGGRTTPLAAFADTAYRLAGDELVWIGETSGASHPRAVHLASSARGADRIDVDGIVPIPAAPLAFDSTARERLREGCAAFARDIRCIGEPRGFAAALGGEPPAFPLDRAFAHVTALADAVDDDNAAAALTAAMPLLGLGAGLTPSGDDFVGAFLYARRLCGGPTGWSCTADRLIDAAPSRTHAIAATLFRDLAQGESFAALARFAAALAHGAHAQDAAREVAAIGHSSGFDMLAGFVVGAAGNSALQ